MPDEDVRCGVRLQERMVLHFALLCYRIFPTVKVAASEKDFSGGVNNFDPVHHHAGCFASHG
jgi:hypothetical protein